MKNCLLLLLLLNTALFSKIYGQDCAGTAGGNVFAGANGRYFIMTYDSQADRDAALALINSITINGTTYNIGPHPTGNNSIRTTPAQPNGTFPTTFTGVVTLNPSGVLCNYAAGVLPISLKYFMAEADESKVLISWETVQEINNEGFEIQKSYDGRNFETFTWVEGAGSTNQSQYYEVKDPEYSEGVHYYRLKQVDYDGEFEFSSIVTVNLKSESIVGIKRNILAQGEELILLSDRNKNFDVFNSSGNKVSSGFIEERFHSFSTFGFQPGMYFIKIEGGSILKFIIK